MTDAHDDEPTRTTDTPGQRLGSIAGDRLCVGCAFNLRGQPIIREERYGLLIARCPECGTVAPMQEYPVLGRWANRWAALLAAAWAVVMIAVVLAGALSLLGAAHAVSNVASEPLAEEIARGFFDDVADKVRADAKLTGPAETQLGNTILEAQARLDGSVSGGARAAVPPFARVQTTADVEEVTDEAIELARSQFVVQWPLVDATWWDAQDHRRYQRRAGGFARAISHVPFAGWVAIVIPAFLYGTLLSAAMFHRRGPRLAGFALVPTGLALALTLLWHPSPTPSFWGVGTPASNVATAEIFGLFRLLVIALGFAAIAAGMLAGRPLARLVLRLLLPPGQRSALAALWTCDGLDPPRPATRR